MLSGCLNQLAICCKQLQGTIPRDLPFLNCDCIQFSAAAAKLLVYAKKEVARFQAVSWHTLCPIIDIISAK